MVPVASRGRFPVNAILEESAFTAPPPDWREIDLTFAERLGAPGVLAGAAGQWRGIYLIFDESDRRAYVGSAYGHANILGRWQVYALMAETVNCAVAIRAIIGSASSNASHRTCRQKRHRARKQLEVAASFQAAIRAQRQLSHPPRGSAIE